VLVPVISLLLEDDTPPLVCDGEHQIIDNSVSPPECGCEDGYLLDLSGFCFPEF
jgi:hypothetical protein